jgi:hypothetical protein
MTSSLTYKRLREVARYDRRSGLFYWKITVGKARRGCVAGHTDSNGYTKISIDGVKHFAHRLAWFYCHKEWPKNNIDHIDRCRNNNRLSNLRDVGQSLNGLNGSLRRNNRSGYTGVFYDVRRDKWIAYINRKGHKKHLGEFKLLQAAVQARQTVLQEIFAAQ